MPKIPGRRINSDDCLITVDGQQHAVHKGEWVEVLAIKSIAQHLAALELQRYAAGGDTKAMAQALESLCQELSNRVLDWNWTDLDSQPLPRPYRQPAIIKSLSEDELLWLVRAIAGESPGERKNA